MLSQQEISDRIEIQELLVRYVYAVDFRDWDAFRRVFAADAIIDYSAFGGPVGDLESTIAYLDAALQPFSSTQHMVSSSLIDFDGDTASGKTICHNPMVWEAEAQGQARRITTFSLWYVDTFRRTPQGWRIATRREQQSHLQHAVEGQMTQQ